GAAVDGIITPSITIESLHDGTHRAVRRYDSKASIHDFLEVPAGIKNDTKSMKSTKAVLEVSPEVYVVVDSTLAKTLGSKNKKIKDYLAVFWNGVQQRFATMKDPKVNLVLSGALIATSNDETYINDNVLFKNYIHGANTLNSLSDWLFNEKDNLPKYDLAYLMTAKDMADVEDNVIQEGLAGIAWRGAACVVYTPNKRSYNTGMGEDIGGYYSGVMTAAHEVAHNLGSPHDGSNGAEACSWNDGYLMSYVSGNSNKLFFSSCSQSLMKQYMSTSWASCLRTLEIGATIPLSSTLPGEKFSMDEQCQKITGRSEAFASKSVSDDSLCVQLECQWKQTVGNYIYLYTSRTGRPAAEGSPCPNAGGSCKNGSCQ
ncbi:MAG: M12 family metallo-peptidase, partial [Cyanobacteria bacterium J06553_1]